MADNSSTSQSKKTFSISEVFSFGWNKTFQNLVFYIVFTLVFIVVYSALEFLTGRAGLLRIIFLVILIAFDFAFGYLSVLIALRVYNNEKLELSKFTSYIQFDNRFWNYVGGGILLAVGFIIGYLLILGSSALMVHFALQRSLVFLLFIIIIVVLSVLLIIYSIALSFWAYIIIDQNKQIIESIKESYRITKRKKWKIFGFLFILSILNIVGFFLLLVGLLITIPISILSMVFLYKKLEEIA
ncbi:MAG: hypothetical protein ACYDAS_01350 [Patescibacteria group bacterium]